MKRIQVDNLKFWCSRPLNIHCDGFESNQPCISIIRRTLCPWLVIGVEKEITIAVVNDRRYVEVQDDSIIRELSKREVEKYEDGYENPS